MLFDQEMPEMDGLKFLGMVQHRVELKDIPVIMHTGRQGQEQKIKDLQDNLKQQSHKLEELSNTARPHPKNSDINDLIRLADDSLYGAKPEERNRVGIA